MYTVKKGFRSAKGLAFKVGQAVEVVTVIGESRVEMVRIYSDCGDSFFTLKSIADKILTKN